MAQGHPILLEIGQGLSIMLGLPTLNSWSTSQRPKQAKRGIFGFNEETHQLEYYDGSSWLAASMDEA